MTESLNERPTNGGWGRAESQIGRDIYSNYLNTFHFTHTQTHTHTNIGEPRVSEQPKRSSSHAASFSTLIDDVIART